MNVITKPKISVILPAYKLEKSIASNIRAVQSVLEKIEPAYEIIVVPDGSPDGTRRAAESVADNEKIFVYDYPLNRGKGYALKHGGLKARGEYIAFLDGDLDIRPETLVLHYELMRLRDADVIIGSKLHPESSVNYPLKRRIYSRMYQLLTWTLFGLNVRDTQVGIKLFRREAIENTLPHVEINSYAFDIELLVLIHRFGFKIVEGPVSLHYRYSGTRVKLGLIVQALKDTAIVFHHDRILRRYSKHANRYFALKQLDN